MQYMEYGAHNSRIILLLHGGGLSWWNYRDAAELLSDSFRVILPVLDGHALSGQAFSTIEENAARLIAFIDTHHGGSIFALGGVSLGGQVAVEMLAQRPDICSFAFIESAMVKPLRLTHALIRPVYGMSFGLIRQKWFSKLQAAYLGIPQKLFDEYYRDTCGIRKDDMIAFLEANSIYSVKPALRNTTAAVRIVFGGRELPAIRRSAQMLHQAIPNSTVTSMPGYRHGELSIRHPQRYVQMLREMFA